MEVRAMCNTAKFHGDCPKPVIEWENNGCSYRIIGRMLDVPNYNEDEVAFYVEYLLCAAMGGERWTRLDEVVPSGGWLYLLLMKLRKDRGE